MSHSDLVQSQQKSSWGHFIVGLDSKSGNSCPLFKAQHNLKNGLEQGFSKHTKELQ